MYKIVLLSFFAFWGFHATGQIKRDLGDRMFENDSTMFTGEKKITLSEKTHYTDYKIISLHKDTTVVDTTLNIGKDFKFNYLRKDDFELLPFHNLGQTFNKLGYHFENSSLFSSIGASAKQYGYKKVNSIYYYHVPTPTSKVMYKSGMEQGQMLQTLLTMNTTPQFNFSVSYKGLRSLGKYRNSLASHGNFNTSFNYQNKNKSYHLQGHFASFDFLNNENGGLTAQSVTYFESNDINYKERARLEVNFTDAYNMFEGKRYFFQHTLALFPKKVSSEAKPLPQKNPVSNKKSLLAGKMLAAKKDSTAVQRFSASNDSIPKILPQTKTDTTQTVNTKKEPLFNLQLGHAFTYKTQHYRFNQSSANPIFGEAFVTNISDHTSYQTMNNEAFLKLKAPILGTLKAKVNYYTYNYHYDSIFHENTLTISDKLKGNVFAIGGQWHTSYGKLHVKSEATTLLVGNLHGNNLKAAINYKKDSVFNIKAFAEITSKTPSFNKLLYQSGYKNYHWENNFKNEAIKNIGFSFTANKWGSLKASYHFINNYTYFNEDSKPTQANTTLNYLKVKFNNRFSYKKFTLENTVLYQNVAKGASFFRVPTYLTRNTLYYSNHLFKKKPLYIQTGVTFKYFTAFKANAYNPLLSEFVLQNTSKIGNFPLLDFFVNGQIRRTRLFLKVENFSANFTGRKYYAAPNEPYRDLTVRFGLVWNWFI